MLKTLDRDFISHLAKQNSHIRDLEIRFKYLPTYPFFKRDITHKSDPFMGVELYTRKYPEARVCIGYAVHKPIQSQYWIVDIHVFILSAQNKVIETTDLYDRTKNTVHYVGIVVDQHDNYIDKFSRLDYIKSNSPASTFN